MNERDSASVQRLDAFVDAAFAFAVSLLVITGSEAPRTVADLMQALARIPAFAAGFALIALFWMGHRSYARLASRRGERSAWLSLLIVFVVLVYVAPLRMLVETAIFYVSGGRIGELSLIQTIEDLRSLYIVYGLGFGGLSALYLALFALAARDERGTVNGTLLSHHAWNWAVCAGSATLSAVAAATPLIQPAPFLPGIVYWLIPLGAFVVNFTRRPIPRPV